MNTDVVQKSIIVVLVVGLAFTGWSLFDLKKDGNPVGVDLMTRQTVSTSLDSNVQTCLHKGAACYVEIHYIASPAPNCVSSATADCDQSQKVRSLDGICDSSKGETCINVNLPNSTTAGQTPLYVQTQDDSNRVHPAIANGEAVIILSPTPIGTQPKVEPSASP